MKAWHLVLVALGLAGLATVTGAKDKDNRPAPPIFRSLLDCKTVPVEAERLVCFEAVTAKMETAFASEDLFITDRNQVREARRTLFGLPVPNIGKLFGGDGSDEEEEQFITISSIIERAEDLGYGKMQFTLTDDAVWQTTELMRFPAHKGQSIQIKRGIAGGYVMKAGNGPLTRVKRTR